MPIVKASHEMAGALSNIAWEAKKSWGYPDAWMDAWRDELTVTEEAIRRNDTWVATGESGHQGFYMLLAGAEDSCGLEHLWVRPDAMGAGLGSRLLRHAVSRAGKLGFRQVLVVADPNAESFYLKRGAKRIGIRLGSVCGTPRELPLLAISPA